MAETKRALVEVELNYTCDTGDGGVLFYDAGKLKDELGDDVYPHRCSAKGDDNVYLLKSRYPRVEIQPINLDLPGLKL